MPAIAIRDLRPHELGFHRQMLWEAVYLPPEEKALLSRDILETPEVRRYIENWGRPGDRARVAEDSTSGQLLGCAWGRLFTTDNPGYGFVDETTPELSIAVIEGNRGQGIGGALLRDLNAVYASEGIHRVSLSVATANPAHRLYERIGYRTVHQDETTRIMVFGGF